MTACSVMPQVVALQVRSAARAGDPERSADAEMDFAAALNRALPDDIRVLGWAPVPEGFSARSACAHPCSGTCCLACMHPGDCGARMQCAPKRPYHCSHRRPLPLPGRVPLRCTIAPACNHARAVH